MKRTARLLSLVLVALAFAPARRASAKDSAPPTAEESKAQLEAIDANLAGAEDRLSFVEHEYVQRKDETEAQQRQERFGKGASAFVDADYDSAVIFFYDLVEDPVFQREPNYDDALYYLAESLFQQRNLLGARHFFRTLLDLHRSHYGQALQRYLTIADKLDDFTNLDHYLDAARGANGALPPEVAYVYGKWLFERHDLPLAQRSKQATAVLEPLTLTPGPEQLAAKYLVGVVQVQQGNYDEANQTFTALVALPPGGERDRRIIELAQLARGRIDYEQSHYSAAIDAYQNIDRDSPHFVESLYEIAWVFVKKGQYDKALRATEILDELAPDSILAPEAKILQAHLQLKLAHYTEARKAYKNVVNAYAPVRDEVDALLALHPDPVKYFDELLARNDKEFDVTSLLPPAARRWATTQHDVADALQVSSALGTSKQGVTDSNQIAAQILRALDEKGANAFPVLQEGFRKAEAVDATLTHCAQRLVDLRRALLQGQMGDLARKLTAAQQARAALEPAFQSLPKSDADVIQRRARYVARLDDLDRTAFQLGQQLDGFTAALNAVEKWVHDTHASRPRDPSAEGKFLSDVKDVRTSVVELTAEVEGVRQSVKSEKLRSGNVSADDRVRAQYQAAVDAERAILSQASANLDATGQALATRIAQDEQRIDADRKRVGAAKAQLQAAVAHKAQVIRAAVAQEQGKLSGYDAEVGQVSSSARDLVGRIAFDSFTRVRKQFYDLVLKADVGLVDVAWTKKQDDTKKIQALSKEKDKQMKGLDEEFKEVLKDVD